MNNHAWFYTIKDNSLINEKEYIGSITQIVLNDLYAAVLCDGKILLHLIITNNSDEYDHKTFSEDGNLITSIVLTNDFLIYSTNKGSIIHFYLKDWGQMNEQRHEICINKIYSNTLGTRIVFIDVQNKGWLYNPVDDNKIEIPNFPTNCENILWDSMDNNCFIAIDTKINRTIITYIYAPQTKNGSVVNRVAVTKVPSGFTTIMFYDGVVHGQKSSGVLSIISLASHDHINQKNKRNEDKNKIALNQLMGLNRFKSCWELALILKSKECWLTLGKKTLEYLDIELSIRIYRELKDTAMVLALQQLIYIEDKLLLSGHINLLCGEYTKAQHFFLQSTQPITALTMRRDLLQWDHAMKLAATLAPDQIPFICREYAQSLEVKGDHQQALTMYVKSLVEEKGVKLPEDHIK
jgi:WD repeat-containing protein 19